MKCFSWLLVMSFVACTEEIPILTTGPNPGFRGDEGHSTSDGALDSSDMATASSSDLGQHGDVDGDVGGGADVSSADADLNRSDTTNTIDAGSLDTGTPDPDDGVLPPDAAHNPRPDASRPDPDNGVLPPDASPPDSDARVVQPDPDMGGNQDPDAVQPDPDTALALDPRDIDNDQDGWTENQGDCRDDESTVYPNATEICDDRLDNNCDGRADFVDPICLALPDTVIMATTLGGPPAMVLNVESYTSAGTLGRGWQESGTIFSQESVSVTLSARQYPPNAFCGIRLNVSIYLDQQDVNDGQIVGEANYWLCMVIDGVPTVDPTFRRMSIDVAGDLYDGGDLAALILDGEPGCSALLILNDQGPCALD